MRVFYSFSLRLDGSVVSPLAAALADLGYEPTIPIGRHIRVHNWRSRLADVLRKSDAAVVIVSPENESNPYVMGELWAARVLSQINRRFVLVPVLRGTSAIPEYVSDLYVANARGGEVEDFKCAAKEIDGIIRDNREFEIAVGDLRHRVFIGHGRSSHWRRIGEFLEKDLNLAVEEYDQTSPLGYTVSARLEQMLSTSSLAIVVMSPEDELKTEVFRARQNVVHEIGLFQGRLGFEKVVVVRHQDCESFSNISGINEIQYESDGFQTVFEKLRHIAVREGLLSKARGSTESPASVQ